MSKDAWMTLYFIPSPKGINWESPTTLARDILKNKLARDNRFMGHVNIELDYYNEQGKHIHFITGMVASNLNAVPLLLKEKIGLGVVFHSFDGRLEDKEELRPEFERRFEKGNEAINFAKFKINNKTAQRVEHYLAEYAAHDIHSYYGLVNSPLHGEGSGCSAFGASFMDVAGLLEEEHYKHWTHCVKVPHKLAGNPIKENKVSFLGLVFGQHRWATDNEDHHEIFFWDPDLMHKWVQEKIQEHHDSMSTYALEKKGNSTGVVFDVTHKETPEGPIFKKVEQKSGKPFSRLPDPSEQSNKYKYGVE